MRKLILIIPFLLVCFLAQAQCVPEIKDVRLDEKFGGVLVETEYILNGNVVDVDGSPCFERDGKHYIALVNPETLIPYDKECIGRNRFLNISGDDASIIKQARLQVEIHRNNLIKRIPENTDFIDSEKAKRITELKLRTSEDIILSIKDELIGFEPSTTEVVYTFKGKDIKVTYDQKNTATDSIIAISE